MPSQDSTSVLFASPREYYETCKRLFKDLATRVPEFYSDWTLAWFCLNQIPSEKGCLIWLMRAKPIVLGSFV